MSVIDVGALAPFSLFPSFPAPLNDNFKQYYNENSEPVARIAAFLGIFIYIAFYFWDLVIDYDHSTETLSIRIAVATLTVPILLLPQRIRTRYLQELYS